MQTCRPRAPALTSGAFASRWRSNDKEAIRIEAGYQKNVADDLNLRKALGNM